MDIAYAANAMGSVKGIILLGIALGREERVLREIRRWGGVKDTFAVYGEYDGVILFETDGQEQLNAMVTKLRKMEGVARSVTLVAF